MRELVDEGGKASPPATPTTEPPPRRKQTLHEKFVGLLWLCCGFYRAPSNATLRLLVTYASAASCLVVISRYLGRYSEVDTIEVVLLQLWAAAFGVGILKLTGKDPTPWALEHGFNEMISWAFLATGFAVQLIASIRTLSSPHITEWYLLLHYLTPCVVPFFEPRPVTDGVDSKRPRHMARVLVEPDLDFGEDWEFNWHPPGHLGVLNAGLHSAAFPDWDGGHHLDDRPAGRP